MLPSEVIHKSLRVEHFNEEQSNEERLTDIDQLEEARDLAVIRSAQYQQELRRYHNRNIRTRTFSEGQLVLRLVQITKDRHKLSPLWDGPFVIDKITRPGKDGAKFVEYQ